MKVITLVSWAGPDFAYDAGDEVDLPEAGAKARIEAGLCRLPDKPPKKSKLFRDDPNTTSATA